MNFTMRATVRNDQHDIESITIKCLQFHWAAAPLTPKIPLNYRYISSAAVAAHDNLHILYSDERADISMRN